ncbi:hypothetical protein MTR_4g009410 [Medicago truncatula]|uniref:Uncharacterized protein n=1 Tax=Medicago truncatula TaxID=3880 RepID=G7JFQ6_MEDTR|nr:hypothetical protein MTR_4g009410 [Medicago truncatula]
MQHASATMLEAWEGKRGTRDSCYNPTKIRYHIFYVHVEIWGLTHPYKTGLYGDDCFLFINSSQESYLSDVGHGFFPIHPRHAQHSLGLVRESLGGP